MFLYLFPEVTYCTKAPEYYMCFIGTHYDCRLDFEDVMDQKTGRYDMYGSYGRSKLAMVLFTTELNYKYAESGIYASAVHPGLS